VTRRDTNVNRVTPPSFRVGGGIDIQIKTTSCLFLLFHISKNYKLPIAIILLRLPVLGGGGGGGEKFPISFFLK